MDGANTLKERVERILGYYRHRKSYSDLTG